MDFFFENFYPEGYCNFILQRAINMEFKNKVLYFTFDTVLPDDWFNVLTRGSYGHSWVMGYDCDRLRKIDKNTITMSLRDDESKETITKIVKNVKSWVDIVSREYSQEAKRLAIAEQRKKEAARKAEIKRIEKEAEVSSTINAVLNELL